MGGLTFGGLKKKNTNITIHWLKVITQFVSKCKSTECNSQAEVLWSHYAKTEINISINNFFFFCLIQISNVGKLQ